MEMGKGQALLCLLGREEEGALLTKFADIQQNFMEGDAAVFFFKRY